jgi:hypothetical protein
MDTATARAKARPTSLTRGEDYVDQGQQKYEEQQRQRSIAALRRRAADLGFTITPSAAALVEGARSFVSQEANSNSIVAAVH